MKQKPIHPSMQPYLEGQVILFNKPLRWTSFDAIRKVRRLTGVSKVGHAGTLDPLATGLLIICTGKFTKRINEFMAKEKEYTGTFTLGATTPTYDLESAPQEQKSFAHITEEMIYTAASKLTGPIMQTPPIHSAIKKDGKPVYLAARKGEEVKLEARPITIFEFEITNIELPIISFRIKCSTGTYIRSMANDFGQLLECGAYLSKLERTKIGAFNLKDALSVESFEQKINTIKSNFDTNTQSEINKEEKLS